MDKLVNLVCVGNIDCPKGCEGDCSVFKLIADDLRKFSEKVSVGLAGRGIVIAELRTEDWYREAVSNLQGNNFVVRNNTFKKTEEELINRLLGMWAQK
jgi:hypothetical protein